MKEESPSQGCWAEISGALAKWVEDESDISDFSFLVVLDEIALNQAGKLGRDFSIGEGSALDGRKDGWLLFGRERSRVDDDGEVEDVSGDVFFGGPLPLDVDETFGFSFGVFFGRLRDEREEKAGAAFDGAEEVVLPIASGF